MNKAKLREKRSRLRSEAQRRKHKGITALQERYHETARANQMDAEIQRQNDFVNAISTFDSFARMNESSRKSQMRRVKKAEEVK